MAQASPEPQMQQSQAAPEQQSQPQPAPQQPSPYEQPVPGADDEPVYGRGLFVLLAAIVITFAGILIVGSIVVKDFVDGLPRFETHSGGFSVHIPADSSEDESAHHSEQPHQGEDNTHSGHDGYDDHSGYDDHDVYGDQHGYGDDDPDDYDDWEDWDGYDDWEDWDGYDYDPHDDIEDYGEFYGFPSREEGAGADYVEGLLEAGSTYEVGRPVESHKDFPMDADYLEEITDDVSYELDYDVEMEYFEYEDYYDEGSYCLYVEYPVFSAKDKKGSGTDFEEINTILQQEIGYLSAAMDNVVSYEVTAYADAHICYMAEDMVSVVYQEQLQWDEGAAVRLSTVCFDPGTGRILNVMDDFRVDKAFTKAVADQIVEQGLGDYLEGVEDSRLMEWLSPDSPDVIAYYTPLGLEIGYNADWGWLTVTLKDYEAYLKRGR